MTETDECMWKKWNFYWCFLQPGFGLWAVRSMKIPFFSHQVIEKLKHNHTKQKDQGQPAKRFFQHTHFVHLSGTKYPNIGSILIFFYLIRENWTFFFHYFQIINLKTVHDKLFISNFLIFRFHHFEIWLIFTHL